MMGRATFCPNMMFCLQMKIIFPQPTAINPSSYAFTHKKKLNSGHVMA